MRGLSCPVPRCSKIQEILAGAPTVATRVKGDADSLSQLKLKGEESSYV
jgi:hypothetical protein